MNLYNSPKTTFSPQHYPKMFFYSLSHYAPFAITILLHRWFPIYICFSYFFFRFDLFYLLSIYIHWTFAINKGGGREFSYLQKSRTKLYQKTINSYGNVHPYTDIVFYTGTNCRYNFVQSNVSKFFPQTNPQANIRNKLRSPATSPTLNVNFSLQYFKVQTKEQ
jgi:hypothetical protein